MAKRGLAWMKMNMMKDAYEDFNKAIELNPMNTSAYIHPADLLMALGKKEAALKDVNRALENEPGNPDTYCLRAEMFMAENKYKTS